MHQTAVRASFCPFVRRKVSSMAVAMDGMEQRTLGLFSLKI